MGVHRGITGALSIMLIVLGVAMVVTTIVHGGGPLSYGLIVGVCFVAAGSARLWLAMKSGES
jgi:hypothetical protein